MGTKGVTAVVGDVEPLVPVGGPRIGCLASGGEVARRWAGRRPQPEGAVDVDPRPMAAGRRGRRRDVVEGAAVHVAGLEADDRRTVRTGGEDLCEVGHVDRPLGVGRHRLEGAGAQPQQAQRPIDRRVALRVGDNPHRRSAQQSMLLDVPAGIGQHVVTSRGERHRICGLPPVTKPNDAWTGKPSSSFSQPPATSSTTAAAGEVTALKAGWSHPVVRMSAAVAASSAPPITNPK